MADLQSNITVRLGVDKVQGEKDIRSVVPAIGRHGQAAGEAWGRGFHNASGKWINLVGGLLRRFGGEFGSQIAEGLHLFEKFDKAAGASGLRGAAGAGVGTAAARGIEGRILSQAGGTALGNAASTGLSAGLGAGGAVAALGNGQLEKILALRKKIHATQLELQFILDTHKRITRLSKYFPTFMRAIYGEEVDFIGGGTLGLPGNMSIRGAPLGASQYKGAPPLAFLQRPADWIIGKGGNALGAVGNFLTSPIQSSILGVQKLLGMGALSAAKLGGGILAGLAIPVAFFTSVAKAQREMQKLAGEAGLTIGVFRQLKENKEFLEVWKKYGEAGVDAARKIGTIKDANERNRKAVKEFGEDGINEYYKLLEAGKTYDEALKKVDNTAEGLRYTWAATGEMIVGWWKKIKSVAVNLLDYLPGGIGPELAEQLQDSERGLLRMQKAREEQLKRVAKDLKVQEDIIKELIEKEEKTLDVEKQLETKRKIASMFTKEMLKDKETLLELTKLEKQIAEDLEKVNKQKQEDMRARLDLEEKLADQADKYKENALSLQDQLNEKMKEYNSYTKKDLEDTGNKIKYLETLNDISKLQSQINKENTQAVKEEAAAYKRYMADKDKVKDITEDIYDKENDIRLKEREGIKNAKDRMQLERAYRDLKNLRADKTALEAGIKNPLDEYGYPFGMKGGPTSMFGIPLTDANKLRFTLSQLALLYPELKNFYVELNKAEIGLGIANSMGDVKSANYYKTKIQSTIEAMRKAEGTPLSPEEINPMVKSFIQHGGRLPILPVMAP